MKKTTIKWISLAVALLVTSMTWVSCNDDEKEAEITPVRPDENTLKSQIVDKNATAETFALFYNLRYYPQAHIFFGHQADNLQGFDGTADWKADESTTGRSDVKEVTGAYPAVNGFDFQYITDTVTSEQWVKQREMIRRQTIEAYNRGQIVTYSWHFTNPVGHISEYWEEDKIDAARIILPGGENHDDLNWALDKIVEFNKTLVGSDGKQIPIIFRPYHQADHDRFWWGLWHCTDEQYIQLYRYTVDYLKSKGVHNFLYAYSPESFKPNETNAELTYSFRRYPGDEYVDIVGIDNYKECEAPFYAEFGRQCRYLVTFADEHNKIPAVTEVGLENIVEYSWFTDILKRALLMEGLDVEKRSLAYVHVWANSKKTFWTPYKGHPAEQDFVEFKNSGYPVFLDKMPNVYVK